MIAKSIARQLLQIKAIKLEPAKPFLWASGWNSPIYCDNRLILSFPDARRIVADAFCEIVSSGYQDVTLIAGVATGAIGHGVLVAEKLGLPFAYIRPEPKSHGLANLIEGRIEPGDRVVVIEDLVSTGKSSLKAVRAVRSAGANVLGMIAVFTYGFDAAEENFRKEGCRLQTLTDYHNLIAEAVDLGIVGSDQLETLDRWRKDPSAWTG